MPNTCTTCDKESFLPFCEKCKKFDKKHLQRTFESAEERAEYIKELSPFKQRRLTREKEYS